MLLPPSCTHNREYSPGKHQVKVKKVNPVDTVGATTSGSATLRSSWWLEVHLPPTQTIVCIITLSRVGVRANHCATPVRALMEKKTEIALRPRRLEAPLFETRGT